MQACAHGGADILALCVSPLFVQTAATRRAEPKFERLVPIISTERYFHRDAEGTAAFKEAKWVSTRA